MDALEGSGNMFAGRHKGNQSTTFLKATPNYPIVLCLNAYFEMFDQRELVCIKRHLRRRRLVRHSADIEARRFS